MIPGGREERRERRDPADHAPGWHANDIPLADHIAGAVAHLLLVNDHDAPPGDGQSIFENVQLVD